MKILQVHKFFYPKGGAETYYLSLIDLLSKKGHEVIPFSMSSLQNLPSEYADYFVSNIDVENPQKNLTSLKSIPRIIWSRESAEKIDRLIKDTKPDIVHLHNIHRHLTPSIIPTIKRHHLPLVMTLHSFDLFCANRHFFDNGKICERCISGKYYSPILVRCIKNSLPASTVGSIETYYHHWKKVWDQIDLFHVASEFTKQKCIQAGLPASKIFVVPLFSVFDEQNNVKTAKKESATPYFLFFGRLSAEKGIKNLIQAFPTNQDFRLKIAGSGPQEAELKQLIQKKPNIEMLGFQNKQELNHLIKDALAVITPSLCYETFGLSVLEPISLGTPVIASQLGALPEIIGAHRTGLLVDPYNIDDITQKINYAFDHQSEMRKMADLESKEKFSTENHYSKLFPYYQSLTSKSSI